MREVTWDKEKYPLSVLTSVRIKQVIIIWVFVLSRCP